MKQTTFIADGKTKIFRFTFPYFLKSDVIIEVDSQPATNYNLIRQKNDLNADIPFVGGEVHFTKPPKIGSVITIRRNLALARIVDYQPTAPYSPTAHNQDMNYVMELIKDMKDEIDDFHVKYTDIIDKDATNVLLEKISVVNQSIADFASKYAELGTAADMSEINNDIERLATEINTLNTQYNELQSQIENIDIPSLPDSMDYVVESQLPTAENNYTWYRKYKSGWVEQGGEITTTAISQVTLPVEMNDNHYTVIRTQVGSGQQSYYPGWVAGYNEKTTTYFTFSNVSGNNIWYVCGMAA